MKRLHQTLTVLIILFIPCLLIAQKPNKGLKLYAHWNDTSIKTSLGFNTDWKDIMGWYDTAKNKEYIITANTDSVYFFEIGDHKITKCDVKWGLGSFTNRDFEVYGHYAYFVADVWAKNKLVVYDLRYLPDSVHEVYSNDTFLSRAHTIFIDTAAKRLYASGIVKRESGGNVPSIVILSLENPEEPTLLADVYEPFSKVCGYIHETFVRNDTAYCSCVEQGLTIANVKDPNNIEILSSITPPYPFNGYNHSSWIDPSGKYLVFVDEVPKSLPIKLYDITDIKHPEYLLHFDNSTKATPHNIYWKDNLLYVSYYEDGVVVFDMTNPLRPIVQAHYDTYPDTMDAEHTGDLRGCWGVYPFLHSGRIIASDRSYGLFVLEKDSLSTSQHELAAQQQIPVYPNPFNEQLFVEAEKVKSIHLFTMQGKQVHPVLQQQHSAKWLIETSQLDEGMYMIEIIQESQRTYTKMLKVK